MELRKLSETYFASPQIDPTDLPALRAAGIKTVICNRPDAEVPPSHQSSAIQAATHAAGLEFVNIPLDSRAMTPDIFSQQIQVVEKGGPVLAYCASGTRSSIAWAAGMALVGQDVDAILNATRDAGYTLDHLRPTLLQLQD